MKNEELFKKAEGYSTVVIWGHAVAGDYLMKILSDKFPDKHFEMCDNDHKKQGDYNGINVCTSKEVVGRCQDALFVLTSYAHQNIMKTELLEAGIEDEPIVYGVTTEVESYCMSDSSKKKRERLEKIRFEIDVAMHCNLDCNSCSQFAALAKPEFVDLSQMKRDFQRLSTLFHGEAQRIFLIGGEPLLNKDIIECIKIARDNFNKADIAVFTNGLLLKKQSEAFWDTCRKCSIRIIVTKYPIKLDYEELRAYVESKNIAFELFGTSEDFKYMSNIGLDIHGNQNPQESFDLCSESNNCIKLRDGKLYTCTRPAVIYKFNEYFGCDLEVCESDYIDIYEAKSGDEILKFLSKPIPFCRYCNNREHHVAKEWCHSSRKMEEWT
jgi:organic radical activating enzyme